MREIVGVQYLRALAALMVVVYHLSEPLGRLGYKGGWPDGLSGGVDVFFVISGIVIWLSTRDKPIGAARFWLRRIKRIVPLYWLVTSVVVAILLVAPAVFHAARFVPAHVLASYAFIPWQHPLHPRMWPLVPAGWTLNYEMEFYLIFGLFLWASSPLRLIGVSAVLLVMVGVGALVGFGELTIAGFYTRPIVLEFVGGMWLGEVFARHERPVPAWLRPVGAAMALGAAAFLVLHDPVGGSHILVMGLPALAIVAGVMLAEMARGMPQIPVLHLLGDASYSIYLTQFITMAAFLAVWQKLIHGHSIFALVFFCIANVIVTVFVGVLCYKWFETPTIRYFRQAKLVPNLN